MTADKKIAVGNDFAEMTEAAYNIGIAVVEQEVAHNNGSVPDQAAER